MFSIVFHPFLRAPQQRLTRPSVAGDAAPAGTAVALDEADPVPALLSGVLLQQALVGRRSFPKVDGPLAMENLGKTHWENGGFHGI